ncbi:MAG: ceramidase domain-containing protein [Pseudomonadota bacterium]
MGGDGLFRQIDGYCERTDFTFWSEPINAVTNAGFVVAALVALLWWWRQARGDGPVLVLVVLVIAIGVGSFLFHTVATVWAAIADVLPILLFIVWFLVLVVRRWFARPWWVALLIGASYVPFASFIGGGVGDVVGDRLNGSESYLPALGLLVVCGLWLRALGERAAGSALLGAAALFTISLAFRTLDAPVCDAFPLGTHFVWHLLNSVLLGGLMVAMVRLGPAATSANSGP